MGFILSRYFLTFPHFLTPTYAYTELITKIERFADK